MSVAPRGSPSDFSPLRSRPCSNCFPLHYSALFASCKTVFSFPAALRHRHRPNASSRPCHLSRLVCIPSPHQRRRPARRPLPPSPMTMPHSRRLCLPSPDPSPPCSPFLSSGSKPTPIEHTNCQHHEIETTFRDPAAAYASIACTSSPSTSLSIASRKQLSFALSVL